MSVKTWEERVHANIDRREAWDCWNWTGSMRRDGYGQIHRGTAIERKTHLAHRAVYELLVGPIPDGLVIDHLCRNTSCVNPNHLEPVKQRVNVLRGEAPPAQHAVKTHCPQGHPYSGDNLYRSRFGRQCRECRRAADRRRRAKESANA